MPDYNIVPTLYLLGADGRVRWSDHGARLRHEEAAPVLQELEREIERALTEQKPPE